VTVTWLVFWICIRSSRIHASSHQGRLCCHCHSQFMERLSAITSDKVLWCCMKICQDMEVLTRFLRVSFNTVNTRLPLKKSVCFHLNKFQWFSYSAEIPSLQTYYNLCMPFLRMNIHMPCLPSELTKLIQRPFRTEQ
jgi:hypothetical protein